MYMHLYSKTHIPNNTCLQIRFLMTNFGVWTHNENPMANQHKKMTSWWNNITFWHDQQLAFLQQTNDSALGATNPRQNLENLTRQMWMSPLLTKNTSWVQLEPDKIATPSGALRPIPGPWLSKSHPRTLDLIIYVPWGSQGLPRGSLGDFKTWRVRIWPLEALHTSLNMR